MRLPTLLMVGLALSAVEASAATAATEAEGLRSENGGASTTASRSSRFGTPKASVHVDNEDGAVILQQLVDPRTGQLAERRVLRCRGHLFPAAAPPPVPSEGSGTGGQSRAPAADPR